MRKLISLFALALALSFGMGTVSVFAGDPPAPADEKGKDKKGGGHMDDEKKKDEKKGGN
jgi:hypothetical protein